MAGALRSEVRTANARLVGEMENESEVAEEGVARGAEGRVGVDVPVLRISIPYLSIVSKKRRMTYSADHSCAVMFPYFPLKSPVWHVSGLLASQIGTSPRLYGSKCAPVPVQLPLVGTAFSWRWYMKGPPVAGRPEKETLNLTPTPSGADTAAMEPRIGLPSLMGSVAT
jgi:hypothetical protein